MEDVKRVPDAEGDFLGEQDGEIVECGEEYGHEVAIQLSCPGMRDRRIGLHEFSLQLCFFFLVFDEAVAERAEAADNESDRGDKFLSRRCRTVFTRQVGRVDDLDVHAFHGFLDLVFFAFFDEVLVDGVLDFGVAFELHVGHDVIGEIAHGGFFGVTFFTKGAFARRCGTGFGLCESLRFEEFGLCRVQAGGIRVNGRVDFVCERALEFFELFACGDDTRMVVRVALFEADEFDFFRDDLGADALDRGVVINIIGFGAGFLFAEFARGGVILGLCGFLTDFHVRDRFVVGAELFEGEFGLIARAVNFAVFGEVGEFLRGFVGFLFCRDETFIEEFEEHALRFLVHVGFHGEEVVDNGLRDHLGFFRGFTGGFDRDEVRLFRVFDLQVFFGECFGIRFFLFIFPFHGVDDRVEDRAALHEFDVAVGAPADVESHGCSLRGHAAAEVFSGAARLDECGRFPLFREKQGDDDGDDGAADDDTGNRFFVTFDDAGEFGEVNGLFAFFVIDQFSILPVNPSDFCRAPMR